MPLATIDVRRPRPEAEVQAVMEAVYQAQREALHVPVEDRQIRYREHRREAIRRSARRVRERSDRRDPALPGPLARRQEGALCVDRASIVRRFGTLGIAPADLLIVLLETALDHWGIRGGQPASDVDLGFSLTV